MIALVPHIVRIPNYSRDNLRGIAAGGDQRLKLTYAPKPVPPVAVPPAPAPNPTGEVVVPPAADPTPNPVPPVAFLPAETGLPLVSPKLISFPTSSSGFQATDVPSKSSTTAAIPPNPVVQKTVLVEAAAPAANFSKVSQVRALPKRPVSSRPVTRKARKATKPVKARSRHGETRVLRSRSRLLAVSLPSEKKQDPPDGGMPVVSVPILLVKAAPLPTRAVVVRQIPIQPSTLGDDLTSLRQTVVAKILEVTGQTSPGPGWWAAFFGLLLAVILGAVLSISTLVQLSWTPRVARDQASLK
jgi:hypothetical protein